MILLCLGLLCQDPPRQPPRDVYVPWETFAVPPVPKVPKIGGHPVQIPVLQDDDATSPYQSPRGRRSDPLDTDYTE